MLKLKLQYFGHLMRTDSLEKTLTLEKTEGRKRRGPPFSWDEDEMVGWHHRFNGHGFEQALGVGDGQGGLVCCSPWGCKESDMNEQLNWTVFIPRVLSLPFPSVPSMAFPMWTQGLLSPPLPTVHALPSKPSRLYLHRNSSHHTTCTRDLVVKF